MVKHVISDEKAEAAASDRSGVKYKGVRKRKWGKWVCEIRLPNSRERIWLGSHDSAEKAARAFDAALFCLRGRSAKFNFPDNPPEIAGGRSLTPSEIQAVATRFANSEPASTTRAESGSDRTCFTDPTPSPCLSAVSDCGVQLDESLSNNDSSSELMWDGPFLNMLTSAGPGEYGSEYGIFPGFDDLRDDFFGPETSMLPNQDFGAENFDGVLDQASFLWNF